MNNMTQEQIQAVKCAHADLRGALQNYLQGSYSDHDWDAHRLSIEELEAAFDFLEESHHANCPAVDGFDCRCDGFSIEE
jgi:hypothetical protein